MQICSRDICTGCMACASVCTKKCITSVQDELGHFFPQVDEKSCVNCGACRKICPAQTQAILHKPKHVYAARSADHADYMSSTSGGCASVLSAYILGNGGVVYGCSGTHGYDVHHVRIDNISELWRLKGSKYVESRMGDVYTRLGEDLKNGKTVLFIGTPCQVFGAKQLFGKYDNLYLADLICHGVAPQKLLREHLENYVQDGIDSVSFREGETFWLSAKKDGKIVYRKSLYSDLYYIGFLKSLFLRESCYGCRYTTTQRVGDITMGDFWGLQSTTLAKEKEKGVSVLLVNTEKGEKFLSACGDCLLTESHSLEEAAAKQAQLNGPSPRHKNAKRFREIYPRIGFKRSAKRCLLENRIKYFLLITYWKLKKK